MTPRMDSTRAEAGRGAVLSPCLRYRWRLDRHLGGDGPVVAVFGVNPSTADASLDDATVRKWRGFGLRLGWSRFIAGNVFGLRATDVREIARAEDPFGEEHAAILEEIVAEADILIPCWGRREKLTRALRPHLDTLMSGLLASGKPVYCWGWTAGGDPKHPQMLGYDTPLDPIIPVNSLIQYEKER